MVKFFEVHWKMCFKEDCYISFTLIYYNYRQSLPLDPVELTNIQANQNLCNINEWTMFKLWATFTNQPSPVAIGKALPLDIQLSKCYNQIQFVKSSKASKVLNQKRISSLFEPLEKPQKGQTVIKCLPTV